jgi:hypothetical protein
VLHMEEVPFPEDHVVGQNHEYLGHTDSDFDSVKCMMKLRLRDTLSTNDYSKFPSSDIIFFLLFQRAEN